MMVLVCFQEKPPSIFGDEECLDDDKGHVLMLNQPLAVCDKTANALVSLRRNDIYVSGSTYFYDGGGCC